MSLANQYLKRNLMLAVALAFCTWLGFMAGRHALVERVRHGMRQWTTKPEADLSKAAQELPASAPLPRREPVRLIYDTDIGNDVDDALALALIHELIDRGEARLLAVTISKDNPWCAPHVDLINTFYGRPDIPIGVVRNGETTEDGKFNRVVVQKEREGHLVFPHDLKTGEDAVEAVSLLRRILAEQPDKSVVIVTVGFLTNMARLLESAPDSLSPLSGMELIRAKIRLYVMMGGSFGPVEKSEYNVRTDAGATRTVLSSWPTPIVFSGYEIGRAITYPGASIERDFNYTADHPIVDAYRAFMVMPYDRPTWDLTAVLYAVRPDQDYFSLSAPGTVVLDGRNQTRFLESPAGSHNHLELSHENIPRLREALVQMVSSPPMR